MCLHLTLHLTMHLTIRERNLYLCTLEAMQNPKTAAEWFWRLGKVDRKWLLRALEKVESSVGPESPTTPTSGNT
jgi:hypothetical protein